MTFLERCKLVCPEETQAIGYVTCMRDDEIKAFIGGGTNCYPVEGEEVIPTEIVDKVWFAVRFWVEPNSSDVLPDMVGNAAISALDVRESTLLNVTIEEVEEWTVASSTRRLAAAAVPANASRLRQATPRRLTFAGDKLYEVTVQLLSPQRKEDEAELVETIRQLFVAGSAVQENFKADMKNGYGVYVTFVQNMGVWPFEDEVVMLVPPDSLPSAPTDLSAASSIFIALTMLTCCCLFACCMVPVFLVLKRSRKKRLEEEELENYNIDPDQVLKPHQEGVALMPDQRLHVGESPREDDEGEVQPSSMNSIPYEPLPILPEHITALGTSIPEHEETDKEEAPQLQPAPDEGEGQDLEPIAAVAASLAEVDGAGPAAQEQAPAEEPENADSKAPTAEPEAAPRQSSLRVATRPAPLNVEPLTPTRQTGHDDFADTEQWIPEDELRERVAVGDRWAPYTEEWATEARRVFNDYPTPPPDEPLSPQRRSSSRYSAYQDEDGPIAMNGSSIPNMFFGGAMASRENVQPDELSVSRSDGMPDFDAEPVMSVRSFGSAFGAFEGSNGQPDFVYNQSDVPIPLHPDDFNPALEYPARASGSSRPSSPGGPTSPSMFPQQGRVLSRRGSRQTIASTIPSDDETVAEEIPHTSIHHVQTWWQA